MVNLDEREDDLIDDLDEVVEDLTEELTEEAINKSIDIPNSGNSEITQYLIDINKFPRLSAIDEIELAKLIQAGIEAKARLTELNKDELTPIIQAGQQARETFINANYKLVVALSRPYYKACTATLTFLDIIQSGNLGLMHAVDKFDPTRGLRFSTFATWWIKQRIRRTLQDEATTVRVPVHVQDWLSKIYQLEQKAGAKLSPEYLAEVLGLTPLKVIRYLQIRGAMSIVYLDRETTVNTEDPTALLDLVPSEVLPPDVIYQIDELEEVINEVLSRKLTDREQYIVTRRFGLKDGIPATLETLGTEFKLTRERIRQIESSAMRKLRSPRIQAELKSRLSIR